jgi:hypothetical protein
VWSGDADGRSVQTLLTLCECPSARRTALPPQHCCSPTAPPASTAMPAGATVCGEEVGIQLIRDCLDGHQRTNNAALVPDSQMKRPALTPHLPIPGASIGRSPCCQQSFHTPLSSCETMLNQQVVRQCSTRCSHVCWRGPPVKTIHISRR